MSYTTRRRMLLAAAAAAALLPVRAQERYPSRAIRLIIPFGAGGITDVVGRLIGQKLGEELGQTVVIENKPGAGGNLAAQMLASSRPDGYTLLLGTVGTQVVNPMLYKRLAYKADSFVPVSLVSNSPYLLAVNQSLSQVHTLQGLAAYARANPGKLNFGSAGNGSSPHLGIELFKLVTQTDIMHVPYKSGAEAVSAALGGQVQIVIDAIPVILPHARDGSLRPVALASERRHPGMPELTTSVEQNLPGFQMGSWNALLAPPGTAAEHVAVLQAGLERALAQPEVQSRLSGLGIDPLPGGRDAYDAHVLAEKRKWQRVIDTAGTTLG